MREKYSAVRRDFQDSCCYSLRGFHTSGKYDTAPPYTPPIALNFQPHP
jgi:hypothetical protein